MTEKKNKEDSYDVCPNCLGKMDKIDEAIEKFGSIPKREARFFCPDCCEYFFESEIDILFLTKHFGE